MSLALKELRRWNETLRRAVVAKYALARPARLLPPGPPVANTWFSSLSPETGAPALPVPAPTGTPVRFYGSTAHTFLGRSMFHVVP
jgi:hypothetical protein